MTFTVSHLGIVVADLERSTRFYCDGLGFLRGAASRSGNEIQRLSEFTEDDDAHWQFVRKDGLSVELMQYVGPKPIHSPGPGR